MKLSLSVSVYSMKRLLPVLMVIGVLLGSTGESFALPECKGPGPGITHYWAECFGTYHWKNMGNKYVGEWKKNVMHGQGTYYHWDGRVQKGIWENGVLKYAQEVIPTVTVKKSPSSSSQIDMHYFIANLAQSLPASVLGLILVFLLRRRFTNLFAAMIWGIIGSVILPLIMYLHDGIPSSMDVVIFAGLWGALYGFVGFKIMQRMGTRTTINTTAKTKANYIPIKTQSDDLAEAHEDKKPVSPVTQRTEEQNAPAVKDSIEVRLEKLKKLQDKGLITEEDATDQRKKILGDL